MSSFVLLCVFPHQWIAQRQVSPMSVYCDRVGCHVLCLQHYIPCGVSAIKIKLIIIVILKKLFFYFTVNLPPTLAKSQVSSVRKNLKMQLLILLKHPASFDYKHQVSTLLTDLGATQAEVSPQC